MRTKRKSRESRRSDRRSATFGVQFIAFGLKTAQILTLFCHVELEDGLQVDRNGCRLRDSLEVLRSSERSIV